jgi:hypothetical protein
MSTVAVDTVPLDNQQATETHDAGLQGILATLERIEQLLEH